MHALPLFRQEVLYPLSAKCLAYVRHMIFPLTYVYGVGVDSCGSCRRWTTSWASIRRTCTHRRSDAPHSASNVEPNKCRDFLPTQVRSNPRHWHLHSNLDISKTLTKHSNQHISKTLTKQLAVRIRMPQECMRTLQTFLHGWSS